MFNNETIFFTLLFKQNKCKELRSEDSREKSGGILYAAEIAHHEDKLLSQTSLHLFQESVTY